VPRKEPKILETSFRRNDNNRLLKLAHRINDLKQRSAENIIANIDLPSFGSYLKNTRLEKGIRLEEVSAATKISMNVLSLIEKEDYAQLPSPSVVRGFLRLYADCICVDKDMVINLYRENLEENAIASSGRGRIGNRLNFWFRLFLFLGLLTGIVASVYYISVVTVQDPLSAPEISKDNMDSAGKTADTKMTEKVEFPPKEEEQPPEKHRLFIQATDDSWIKLIIDGKMPEEYTLSSGDRLELEALNNFNILIGNANGIKLTLDEKPVPISGKKGQVLTLKLP
jgi:cytoskeleton protein RodZ